MSVDDERRARVPLPVHDFVVHLIDDDVAIIAFDLDVPPASDWLAELTPGQTRVVALALAGEKDQAIAERLGLSRHTVSNHLRNAYRKLGVTTRHELCSLLGGSSPL